MAWLSGYTTRIKLTTDYTVVDSDLTDFPILVHLEGDADGGSDNFDFAKANTDGFDIRFTSSDGETILKYERERHDNANERAEYWVKVPSVSSSAGTDIYIYCKTADTADGADPTNVWDSNFISVYHLDDPDTGTHVDDSTTANDGSKKANAEPSQVDAKIYKGQHFDGSNDYIKIPRDASLEPSLITLEVFVSLDVAIASQPTNFPIILQKYIYADTKGYSLNFRKGAGDLIVLCSIDSEWRVVSYDVSGWSADTDYHVAATYDGSNLRLYVDGVEVGTPVSISGTIAALTTQDLNIGAHGIGSGVPTSNHFDGIIDEVRISDDSRTAAWIKASYNSGNDSLVSFGSEEVGGAFAHSQGIMI